MDKEQLVSLREKILEDVMPLVVNGVQNGSDRFDLLLRVIQAGNASSELYKRAYESAKAIGDNDDRLEALLSLLDEVDYDVNQDAQKEVVTKPTQEISSQNTY